MAIRATMRSIVETVAQTANARCLLGFPACWGPGSPSVPSAIHLSSSSRSPADCHRASGSLARHFLMTRSSDDGVMGWRVDIAGGSRSRIAAIRLAWLCPSNERLPVTISYTIAPKAKISARGSASFPSSCSGAMYCRVPRMVPSAVIGVRVGRPVVPNGPRPSATSFASPKSRSLRRIGEHDVARLEVPMHDVLSMRLIQRVGQLNRNLQGFVERQPVALQSWASVCPSRNSMTR